ncbi:hypothetical protein [Spirosoma aerolatum]|uniref:hypothetical protein n=1 Tax=Spirosoma aerolatum TaxID=1211326 RepID=UPI0009ACE12F|nr:hypothetical protein [Spirosoma aerolatum]
MKKGKFNKLRNKIREAEERGFNEALDMMKEFVMHNQFQQVGSAETWHKVLCKIIDLRTPF